MNTKIFNRKFYIFAYAILAIIITLSLSISSSSLIITHPELAVGITYDLTLTAPLLYLFLIWKTKIPKTTVVLLFVISIVIASYLIPTEQQFHLSLIKTWILPFIEIGVLSFIGFSVYRSVKTYKSVKDKDSDILNVLQEVSEKIIGIPALAKVFAFEIAVFYYAFISWRKPLQTEKTFTYHHKSGKMTLFGAIIFIIGIETIILHVLVAMWNVYIAWILTITSVYVLFQLFAHMKALYQRPIEFIGDKLHIRYGLFTGTEIELENIESVESISIMPAEKDSVKQVALLGELEHFNTKIQLKKEANFNGFYGMKNEYKTLLLYVDDAEKFTKIIKPE